MPTESAFDSISLSVGSSDTPPTGVRSPGVDSLITPSEERLISRLSHSQARSWVEAGSKFGPVTTDSLITANSDKSQDSAFMSSQDQHTDPELLGGEERKEEPSFASPLLHQLSGMKRNSGAGDSLSILEVPSFTSAAAILRLISTSPVARKTFRQSLSTFYLAAAEIVECLQEDEQKSGTIPSLVIAGRSPIELVQFFDHLLEQIGAYDDNHRLTVASKDQQATSSGTAQVDAMVLQAWKRLPPVGSLSAIMTGFGFNTQESNSKMS
jgi:hypothetical protein